MEFNQISRRKWLLKCASAFGAAGALFSFGNKVSAADCEQIQCADLPTVKPTPPSVFNEKWDLWTGGTCLRGANIWQKKVTPDEGMGPGPIDPPYSLDDFPTLAGWGANYINISHPGVYSEEKNGSGQYVFDEAVFSNLESLIQRAEEANLFVVVSFRTGPGRMEIIFDGKEKGDVWDSDKAQSAWVEMWRDTASRLKNKKNVVGYDLMVEPEIKRYEKWNRFAARIASRIRSVDKKTPILIGGVNWSAPDSLPCLLNSTESKIVYAAHPYNPEDYVQQNNGANIVYPGGNENIYRCMYGFKVRRRVPLAINEFGAKRWAPGIVSFLEEQFDYIERIGANHALWLWETSFPLNYDQFNFRHGTPALIDAIKKNWSNNTVRFTDVGKNF